MAEKIHSVDEQQYEIGRRDQKVSDVDRIEQLETLLREAENVLESITTSEALKEAPFYSYSEAIDRANTLLRKIQGYWR